MELKTLLQQPANSDAYSSPICMEPQVLIRKYVIRASWEGEQWKGALGFVLWF